MSKMDKRWEFWWKIACLICLAWMKGIKAIPYSFYRTAEEQKKKYDAGQSLCDGYKNRSKHQEWLAIDLAIPKPDWSDFEWSFTESYRKLGELAEHIGLFWGHRWHEEGKTKFDDIFHIEYKE